jgi:hypothetical protein
MGDDFEKQVVEEAETLVRELVAKSVAGGVGVGEAATLVGRALRSGMVKVFYSVRLESKVTTRKVWVGDDGARELCTRSWVDVLDGIGNVVDRHSEEMSVDDAEPRETPRRWSLKDIQEQADRVSEEGLSGEEADLVAGCDYYVRVLEMANKPETEGERVFLEESLANVQRQEAYAYKRGNIICSIHRMGKFLVDDLGASFKPDEPSDPPRKHASEDPKVFETDDLRVEVTLKFKG